VMEYVEGLPVTQYCAAVGANLAQRLDLFVQICDATAYAHSNLIVHRDLKASNILVTAQGQVKLLDFGVAKMLDLQDVGITSVGDAVGTPAYMSPEQWDGALATSSSDIYALGVMAYKLLTGQRPFRGTGRQELIKAQLLNEPQRASELNPALPNAVDEPLARMLAKQPAARPGSATEAIASLSSILSGLDVGAEYVDSPSRFRSSTMNSESTISGELNASKLRPTRPRGRAFVLATALTVLLSLLAWAGAVTRRAPEGESKRVASPTPSIAALPSRPVESAAEPPRAAEAEAAPAPGADRIAIVVEGAPNGAALFLNGVRAGSVAEPMLVPRGTTAVALGIAASGLPLQTYQVVPDRDRVITFIRPRSANPRARKPGHIPGELEF